MMTLRAAPTHALSPAFLRDIRTMLDGAFEGDFSDEDWAHATGGLHVWMIEAPRLVSHGSLVTRTFVCSGHRLSVGYVEAVATAASDRRKGHGAAVMRHIGALIRERYVLGALSTGTPVFYEALGWERWKGPTFVDSTGGRIRTPDDDGGVMILRTPRSSEINLVGEIVCDWRVGDVW